MTFVMLSISSSGIQPKLETLALLTINVACCMWLLINHSRCVQNTFQGLKKSGNDTIISMLSSPAREEWNKGTAGEASVAAVSEKLPAKQSDL